MRKKIFKNIEWGILICTILLILIGLVALFSATQNAEYEELKKQIMWLCISIPIFIVVIFIDYEIVAKASPIFYGIFLILLIAVLFTKSINGATSWFNIGSFSIQPSEFAKIFVILVFAKVVSKIEERGKKEISRPTRLSLALAVVAVPVALIVIQPDYGTALAFLVATVMILYTAGIDKKYIITSILLVVILLPILYFFVLPDHAKTRIDVFLNPNLDPRGSGYNIIQSKLAIGAGELFGMGVLKGNQTQLGFLYPKTTDFIFAVIGEEMGFVATAGIVILYVILITKTIYVAKTAKDNLGSYIAMGIAGIFIFHMVENIGMTIGLLPITGVPLPFVSYGGSSMLTNLILIALVLNISGRRQKTIFVE
ncbi:MAG: rod shape-determining protein RodA [Clostridia bacterium]|nr:rod shape-determining protein RodA [Clostridia bacterium]